MARIRGGKNPLRSQGFKQTDNLKAIAGQQTQQATTQMHLLQQLVVEQQRTNALLGWLGHSQGFPPPPA